MALAGLGGEVFAFTALAHKMAARDDKKTQQQREQRLKAARG
jgi:hypothetical protein